MPPRDGEATQPDTAGIAKPSQAGVGKMNSNLTMPNMLTPNEAAYRLEFSAHMRKMEIPGFPRKIEIPDLHNFIRTRLSQTAVMWPEQAIQLLGYNLLTHTSARKQI